MMGMGDHDEAEIERRLALGASLLSILDYSFEDIICPSAL